MIPTPLVSVIIPTYKRSMFISRAIESVLEQTYKNIEIIIVDDNPIGSEENILTKKVASQFRLNHNVIYYDLDKNYGGAIARNKGLEKAQGKYVNFLDDDDELLPHKIEKQVQLFETSDKMLSVVGGFAEIIDADGKTVRIEKSEVNGDVYLYQLSQNICTTSIALIRKEIALQSGGFTRMPSSQEHLFFINIFKINPYYDYVPELVLRINHHDNDRISTGMDKPEGAIMLFDEVMKYSAEFELEMRKKIIHSHLLNISRAYLTMNNKKKSLEFIIKMVKNDRHISIDSIKLLINIILGYKMVNLIRRKVSRKG